MTEEWKAEAIDDDGEVSTTALSDDADDADADAAAAAGAPPQTRDDTDRGNEARTGEPLRAVYVLVARTAFADWCRRPWHEVVAAADSDEKVFATVAAWEQAHGLPVRDWRAIGKEERGGYEEQDERAYAALLASQRKRRPKAR